jgi:hypothetical protein
LAMQRAGLAVGSSFTQKDVGPFLVALRQVTPPGFGGSPSTVPPSPQVLELCKAASANACKCKKSWDEIASVGSQSSGNNGQARAFGDCYRLYSSVANMCGLASCPPSAPPVQQSMPAPPAQTPLATPGASMPPPPKQQPDPAAARSQQAVAQLSPQCRSQLNGFLQGADTGDSGKAAAAYDSLRAQCDAQVQALASAEGMGLPERKMTSRLQRLQGRAMSGDVGALPGTAEALAQGGGSFDSGEVLEFGLTLLNVLSGVAGVYAAMPGGAGIRYGSNMGSIGNRSVRGTSGQGAPPYRPQSPSSTSTITGTGR